jgi:hypothetical protein
MIPKADGLYRLVEKSIFGVEHASVAKMTISRAY